MTCNQFLVDGKVIPFYTFKYKGEYHKYLRVHKNMYLPNGFRKNEYFNSETAKQWELESDSAYPVFIKATMIIIHYFADNIPRDLDNIEYKSVIDAIKKLLIIPDDSYKELTLLNIGDISSEESISVYVVPRGYTIQFMQTYLSKYFTPNANQIITNKENKKEDDFWEKWRYEL